MVLCRLALALQPSDSMNEVSTNKRTPKRLGLRQEASLFLPISTLALMVLSVVSMLSYRNALVTITKQERASVLAQARQAASILPLGVSSPGALRRALGPGTSGALVEPGGLARVTVGDQPEGNLFAPLSIAPSEPLTAGPDQQTMNRVVAWLPLRNGLVLRADRPQLALATEWVRWRRLVVVVTLAVGALGTLLLLYLRRIFLPIDSLLRTARQLQETGLEDNFGEGEDEIELLVHRFEQAMNALRQRRNATNPEALQQQLEALQQTFSHLESGMALVDLDGNVLALNQAGAMILELEGRQLPAPMSSLLQQCPPLLGTLATAMSNDSPFRRQECYLKIGGRDRTLGLTLSHLTRDDGTARGWIVLFADLTDAQLEAKRERLSTSLRQLAELSAGLAHELRNSLASMQGYAALLHRADLPAASAADTVALQREIDQLHRIVEDFLSFARPGTTRLEKVDLLRLAHRVAGDPALEGAAIKVRAVASEPGTSVEDWVVQGDEQLLHRLLRNLLLNAVRAQKEVAEPEAVAVRLVARPNGVNQTMTVHIEDRGPGLSTLAQDNLFVPFSTDSKDGSGLGLAVARRIADLHGARLEVLNRKKAGVRASVTFDN